MPAQDAPSPGSRSILEGVYSASQASRGEKEFQRACASCHAATDHTGRKFGMAWAGTTLDEVFALISTTMPENDPGSLAPEAYAGVLAFYLKESGYKNGDRDLPADRESLRQIRIEPLPR